MGRSIRRRKTRNDEGYGFSERLVDTSPNLLVASSSVFRNCNNNQYDLDSEQTKRETERIKAWTPEWVFRRIKEQATGQMLTDLTTYTKKGKRKELTEDVIQELRRMAKEDAIWYINLLHSEPKRVIATGKHQMDLKGSIQRTDTGKQISIKALLDSGCTGSCIDETFVDKHGIETRELPKPIPVYNADGTPNANGMVTRMAQLRLTIGSHSELMNFAVSTLDKNDVFLGHDWLQLHNPEIDWNQKTLTFTRCPSTCGTQNNHQERLEEGERLFMIDFDPGTIHVRSKATTSTLIAEKNQVKRMIEEIIPKHYLPYREVFEKKTFNEMPPR